MRLVTAIIVAAGEGKRFGSPKQFALLRGRPVLDWSIESLASHPGVDEIVLVLPDEGRKAEFLRRHKKLHAVTSGGPKRQDSVWLGFERVDSRRTGLVLVHDGVRPLLSQKIISRVIAQARRSGAAIPAVPLEDTIKEVARGEVIRTLGREGLFRVQTPQGFSYSLLGKALRQAREEGYYGTDEAGLVERAGHKVTIVAGDPRNIKVTTPADLKIAEALLEH
jgi:2-C-methyl-D-erythritol 4-phosphate cytidylyltransferase